MAGRFVSYTLSFLSLFLFSSCSDKSRPDNTADAYLKSLREERALKDKELLSQGVIEDKDISGFKGLRYFEPDTKYRIQAKIKKLPPLKVMFSTNTDRSPEYYTYCLLEFSIADTLHTLIAYSSEASGEKGLFVPFKDLSNPNETYGGGRYLDLPYPGDAQTLSLDFNLAYNPYCHYNHQYSCPLVPEENHLKTRIPAGEKKLYD